MRAGNRRLDRAVEVALATGLLASGTLFVWGLAAGHAPALRAGVVLLMFTPVARVAVVALGLGLERDWTFTLIALWILATLVSSLHVAGFF